MPRLMKWSLVCGLMPLLAGIGVYVLWRIQRWTFLETIGLASVFLGGIVVAIGAGLLVTAIKREHLEQRVISGRRWLQAVLVALILLVNFPVAGLLALSAVRIGAGYTVSVLNASGGDIESFVIRAPGVDVDLGPIPPETERKHYIGFTADGSLDFTAEQSGNTFSGMLEKQVRVGLEGFVTIHVTSNGQYQIIDKRTL